MIERVIERRSKNLGGFEVGRVLPDVRRRMVGPFIFFDHMGPVDFPAGLSRNVDVRPHPHIGLSTVTYLFEGEIVHRDSVGSVQPIRAGEVNWMTAGRGVTHSERFERARLQGDRLHGVQCWVALPSTEEECDPDFVHHPIEDLPLLDERGAHARLVVGSAFGARSKVTALSPTFFLHWNLADGAMATAPAGYPERAVYVVSGAVEIDGRTYDGGKMLVLAAGSKPLLRARGASTILLVGGEPLGDRFIEWNFVSSSRDRIAQAKADWRAGRMKLPYADDKEFIPLPPDPPPPAEPMS